MDYHGLILGRRTIDQEENSVPPNAIPPDTPTEFHPSQRPTRSVEAGRRL